MEQISENKNALFKRQELVFVSDKNLTFEEAKKEVSGMTGKDESNVDIYNVKGGFGNQKFVVKANVYDNKEDLETMKNMELSKKKKKEIGDAKVKAEEEANKPAEAPKEEADAEEEAKVEEVKEEGDEGTVSEDAASGTAEEKKEEVSEEKPSEDVKEKSEAPASE